MFLKVLIDIGIISGNGLLLSSKEPETMLLKIPDTIWCC